jgi:hypothetical protein
MDTIIVGVIVAGAVFWVLRTIIRTFKGEKRCECSGEHSCSCAGENASSCTANPALFVPEKNGIAR